MSDGDRLRAYCSRYPDDDLAHRAYADWLEEQGDGPRAEFVRLQLDRAALWDGHPDDEDLWDRDRALVAKHGAAWRAELPAFVRDAASFSRGLLTHFEMDGWKLLTTPPGRRDFTILGLRLRASEEEMAEIAAGGFLSGVRSLTLLRGLSPANAAALATGGHLAALRRLVFQAGVTPAALGALLHSPDLKGLESLQLFSCEGLVDVLAAPEASFRLRRLVITNSSDPINVRALAAAASCAGLGELTVSNITTSGRSRSRHPAPAFPRIDLLDFSRCRAPLSSLLRCLRALGPCRPRRLSLAGARIQGEAVGRVLSCFDLGAVEELNLATTALGEDGWAELCGTPMPRLQFLHLQRTGLTDQCLVDLARSPLLATLRQLRLAYDQGSSAEAFRLVFRSPAVERIEDLSCTHMELGPKVAEVIASSAHLGTLRCLSLGQNQIGPAGAKAIAASTRLPSLVRLDLSSNAIGPEGAEALLASPLLERLVRLDVAGNNLGPDLRSRFRQYAGDRPWQV